MTEFHRASGDGAYMVALNGQSEPRIVEETLAGVWLVFDPFNLAQNKMAGVAVYRYENGGWKCEEDARKPTSTAPECWHVKITQDFLGRTDASQGGV